MRRIYLLIVACSISVIVYGQTIAPEWIRTIGNTGDDIIQSIYTDNSGNVFISGEFEGTVDFDPGSGVSNLTSLGGRDGFFAKYSSSGTLVWAYRLGGSIGDEVVYAITGDGSGNVFVAGFFSGTVNFNPTGTFNRTSNGGLDMFVAKYTDSGSSISLSWHRYFGSVDNDYAISVVVDDSGNVYITGAFTNTVNFDPALAIAGSVSSVGGFDVFVAKYNSLGAFGWVKAIGSTGDDRGRSVDTDGTSVWIGGSYSGTTSGAIVAPHVGLLDGFLAQFSTSSGLVGSWATIRSSADDIISTIALDDDGNIFSSGYFSSTATMFGGNSTSQSVTSNGDTDIFVAQHDTDSFELYELFSVGGSGADGTDLIAVDAGSNAYISGYFNNTVDFDPSEETFYNLTSEGNADAFLARYSSSGDLAWATSLGSVGEDEATTVAIDDVDNVYVGGVFENTIDLDDEEITSLGLFDSFFAKLNQLTLASEPTVQPTNLIFSSITNTGFSYSFTHSIGSHDGYLHLRKAGSAPTFIPVDGVEYAPDDVLSDGSIVQYSDNFPSGTSSSLLAGTTYFYKIYVYNGAGSETNYLTTGSLSGSVTTTGGTLATEPTAQPTNLVFSSVTNTGFTYTYTSASGVDGYLVLRKAGSSATSGPIDGTTYTAGNSLGDATIGYVGTATSLTASSLTAGTTYHLQIFAFKGSGSSINYKQTSPLTGSVTTTGGTLATEPTASPTNLTFTNIGSSTFDINFTAASPAPAGYIGIASKNGVPSVDPVDGTAYTAGQSIGNGFVSFMGTGTTYNATGADPDTRLDYKVYAYNGSGTSINYRATNPAQNHVTTLPEIFDADAPEVTYQTAATVKAGESVTIQLTITDESEIPYVYIDYGKMENVEDIYSYGDDDDIKSAGIDDITVDGSTYSLTIPASEIGAMGLVYLVYAYDEFDNEYLDEPRFVQIESSDEGVTIPYTAGKAQSNYRIVSVPLELTIKTTNGIFGDELGNYGDKSAWRMFKYSSANGHEEMTGSSQVELGKGYWLIASNVPSDGLKSGIGRTKKVDVYTETTFPSITLTAGWNLIGNPYPYNLLWQDVKDFNPDLTLGQLFGYSGSYASSTSLRSFSGGFVMSQTNGTLRFPLIRNSAAGRTAEEPMVKTNPIDSDDWEVLFSVTNGDLVNTMGGFGMNSNALDQSDEHDGFTLPRFLDYLELNHEGKKFQNIPMARDIVPLQEKHIWEFSIASNSSEELVELSWDNSFFGSNEKQLVLWDVSKQLATDMRVRNTYHFLKGQSSRFKVFYGSPAFIQEAVSTNDIVLHSAFPTPALDHVTFAFSIPRALDGGLVSLEVIDAFGKKVAIVMEGTYAPGYHEVVWYIQNQFGADVANGLYIAQLKAGLSLKTQKVLIKK